MSKTKKRFNYLGPKKATQIVFFSAVSLFSISISIVYFGGDTVPDFIQGPLLLIAYSLIIVSPAIFSFVPWLLVTKFNSSDDEILLSHSNITARGLKYLLNGRPIEFNFPKEGKESFMVKLLFPDQLPEILLDAHANDKTIQRTVKFIPSEKDRYSLEGDFDKHFRLYANRKNSADILSIISPEFMELLIEKGSRFDIYFYKNTITVSSLSSEANSKSITAALEALSFLERAISRKQKTFKINSKLDKSYELKPSVKGSLIARVDNLIFPDLFMLLLCIKTLNFFYDFNFQSSPFMQATDGLKQSIVPFFFIIFVFFMFNLVLRIVHINAKISSLRLINIIFFLFKYSLLIYFLHGLFL